MNCAYASRSHRTAERIKNGYTELVLLGCQTVACSRDRVIVCKTACRL